MKLPFMMMSWLAIIGLLQGCSTWKTVPIERAQDEIRAGDTVRVTRADGFQKSFKVLAPVVGGTIRGKEGSVALEQTTRLEKRVVEESKIGAGVTILALVAAIILASTTTVLF